MSAPAGKGRVQPGEQAEAIFLATLGVGDSVDIEVLCHLHPALADELRELAARWDLASRLRGPAFGAGADPPSLPGPMPSLAARLAAHGTPATRYFDEGELARGAQGVVRRAFDAMLQRHVAMKVLRDAPSAGPAPGASRRLARFLDEAQLTAQLEHPAIVPVHELGVDAQGAAFFTMKLVRGRSLHDVLAARERGAAPEWTTARLVGVLVRVAEAMAFAHDRGVMHRDLKPANVMLGDYGEVYVMDWGLARVAGAENPDPGEGAERGGTRGVADGSGEPSPRTLEGDVVGTPQYMPPEQAAGEVSRLGPAADVYALGAMLYHVLAGRPPYAAPGSSPLDLLDAVRSGPPAPLPGPTPGVPAELSAICDKAMAREAGLRYAGMGDLATDLRAFLEGHVVRAYEEGPLATLRKWVGRNRALAVASAGMLLALVAGLAWSAHVEAEGRRRAESAQAESDRHLAEVLRLSDLKRLEDLRREADALWPADPEHVPALEAWLGQARDLLARADIHRATLADLRARALPLSAADERRDREDPSLAAELKAEQDSLAALQPMLAAEEAEPSADPAHRAVIVRKMKDRQAAIDRVKARLAERRTWRFASEEDEWWHGTLASLLDELPDFVDGTIPDVESRLRRARNLERISLVEPASAWAAAIESIADTSRCPAYSGLRLAPQRGLVPLGLDAHTGLWSFCDVQLGDAPAARADGSPIVRPETGVLFVLLPGGTCTCGSQSADPTAPNYDRFDPRLTCLAEARLEPFFLAAHEITQAQWERAGFRNLSLYQAPTSSAGNTYTETNPVENVTWDEARTFAEHFNWQLPTEAQWEYACRAGTTTRWWTGTEIKSLQGAENIADSWLEDHGGGGWEHESVLDDGHSTTAPVGSYRPNAFGLFDMAGNVSEWILDDFHEIARNFRDGDGLQPGGNPDAHPARGGDWSSPAAESTSAYRNACATGLRSDKIGLRIARRIDPSR